MRICVTDTETTGMEENDQVLELAVGAVDLEEKPDPLTIFSGLYSWLIRPTVPIHPAARGAHHITDLMLRDAPTFAEFLVNHPDPFGAEFSRGQGNEVVLCAHNAEFDVRLLQQSLVAAGHLAQRPDSVLPVRTIDTFVCARHLWTDAPGYGNQTLRYWLGLDDHYPNMTRHLELCGLPPHRAKPDVIVTGYLIHHMLVLGRTAEELIRLSATPVLQEFCRMPKHAGKTWEEVARIDRAYCTWMLSQGPEVKLPGGNKTGFDADTIHTLKYHLGLL